VDVKTPLTRPVNLPSPFLISLKGESFSYKLQDLCARIAEGQKAKSINPFRESLDITSCPFSLSSLFLKYSK